MSDLKKEELLEWLNKWFTHWDSPLDEPEQAHQQIKEMIQASDNLRNKSLGRLAEDLGVSFSAAKIISDHAQSQVTEGWIEEKAVEIYNYLYYKTFNLDQVRGFIRLLVDEIQGGRDEKEGQQYVDDTQRRRMPRGVYPRTKEVKQKMRNSMMGRYNDDKHPNWNGGVSSYWSRKGREAWKKHFGFEAPAGCDVHHIDGDETNNNANNLALVTHGGHSRIHNPIKNKRLKRDWHGRFIKLNAGVGVSG